MWSCATTERDSSADRRGRRPRRPVVAADHSGQSRSANQQGLNKGKRPKLQSRGKSKRVKTLLAVLIRKGVRGEGRNRNLPSPRRVFAYFLHEQKVWPPAGCAGRRFANHHRNCGRVGSFADANDACFARRGVVGVSSPVGCEVFISSCRSYAPGNGIHKCPPTVVHEPGASSRHGQPVP